MKREKVRFWHYGVNEPVLITIKAGQTLSHTTGGPTDEGWHRDLYQWDFDGEFLRREHVSDGTYCDGRMTDFAECLCHVSQVANGNIDPDVPGLLYPALESR